MKRMDDGDVFESIAAKVVQECKKRAVDGVFAMTEIRRPTLIRWNLSRRDSVLDDASDGKKYNLHAIALSKLSAVLAHGVPSGGEVKYEGETPYRGGIPSEDGEFAYAFSGGTENQDVEIVKSAEEFHKSLK